MDKRLLSKCIWFMQLTIINTEGQPDEVNPKVWTVKQLKLGIIGRFLIPAAINSSVSRFLVEEK